MIRHSAFEKDTPIHPFQNPVLLILLTAFLFFERNLV